MKAKKYIDIDVLTAAKQRISFVFDAFHRVYVSFSGGKDSTVMLDLVAAEARRRGRRFGLLFIDLEAQYRSTIDFVFSEFARHSDVSDPYWVALPLALRNASSVYQTQWTCWDLGLRDRWVREPPKIAITDATTWPWFTPGMEFEDFVSAFGIWYAQEESACCLVGIRADESLNRFRAIAGTASRFGDKPWTTVRSGGAVNAYPIYDWRVEDVWRYHASTGAPYNHLYDMMHAAGLTPSQMRICQPYGDDQRKGLWLYHVIEPETWPRVVARVSGANSGALFAKETGNVSGVRAVSLPTGHTWKSYVTILLDSLPPPAGEHYRNKIALFIKWYEKRGYPGGIPDEADRTLEAKKKVPSWRRICKTILRNDWWCKGLGFAQHRSGSYEAYAVRTKKKREQWEQQKTS